MIREQEESLKSGIARWWKKNIFGLVFAALLLFISAGDLNWPVAWIYLGCVLLIVIANASYMDPGLVAERSELQEGTEKWDLLLSIFVGILGPLLILVLAGFDRRFGWSGQFATALQAAALLLLMTGGLLGTWAMSANRFFSATVRLQNERGHRVINKGPYRHIRHPGYTGGIVSAFSSAILLGSWYALIAALLVAAAYVVRTKLEDDFLQQELEGYRDYAGKTRYRLVPGLW